MAFLNSSDPTYSIIEEVTPGTTPEVGTRYELPVSTEQAPPTYSTAQIASNTKRPKRASNGAQQGAGSLEWNTETRLQKAAVFDLLLKSALSGTWVGNKLSAGDTDTYFSVITTLKPDTGVDPAPANGMYYVDAGMIANSVEIACSAGEGANVTVGAMGMKRFADDTDHPASVTAIDSTAREFTYKDLKNVKLVGPSGTVDLGVSSLNLSITHEREQRLVCGVEEAVDIGTSGARKVSGEISIYRESFQINSDVTGEAQKLSFEVTRNGVGYRFTVPAATFQKPSDELSGSSILVKLTFDGGYDDTAKTDVFIERL